MQFLNYHGGPGVQHIAFHTEDIIHSVREIRKRGLQFITVPSNYYRTLFESSEASVMLSHRQELEELGILLDVSKRDRNSGPPSLLLQTFTAPIQDRPTLFLEVISRHGSTGFGKKTIKALFEAVERLQDKRREMEQN